MKLNWLGISAIALSISGYAQDSTTTGYILYNQVVDISDNPWTQNRPDAPTEWETHWETYFTPEESYCKVKPQKEEDAFNTGGVQFRSMRWEPKDVYFMDFENRDYHHYNEFMGREFNISDTLSMAGWQMTGKQGIVLGYPCMEVKKMQDDTVQVIAWFTPRIPVSTGPVGYTGFPGAVLYVNIDDGKTTISATQITMGKTTPEPIEFPEDGTEMGKEEYETLVREKTAEMTRRWRR